VEYADILKNLRQNHAAAQFQRMYGKREGVQLYQLERYMRLLKRHRVLFGESSVRIFSAPGRTEIGGNHTDHNKGRVLAAAVTMDMLAFVSKSENMTVTLHSEGYPRPFIVDLSELAARDGERGSTSAMIRGVASRMCELGMPIGGFNAVVSSTVAKGSGLSSSAAVEVLIACILDGLYGGGNMDPKLRAQIAQYTENTYLGKPSGLMDQTASSVGGLVTIDFRRDDAQVTALQYDFAAKGYAMCVVEAGGNHAGLTAEYAAIPAEMRSVAAQFGAKQLREVFPEQVEKDIHRLRGVVSDRAILRALHYFDENARVKEMVAALKADDLPRFLELIIESGDSSWKLLQNISVAGGSDQGLALALELSRRLLKGRGAWRVHGGGFAGTILSFVPADMLADYVAAMDGALRDHATTVLDIRPLGATEFILKGE